MVRIGPHSVRRIVCYRAVDCSRYGPSVGKRLPRPCLPSLMGSILAKDDLEGATQDLEVHPEGPVADVLMVELDPPLHLFQRLSFTAIPHDLGQPGYARLYFMPKH